MVRTLLALFLALAAGPLAGCVPLPVRLAPGVTGRVVDAATREPLAGAVVVVRFEGSYDEVLPERELLGHREAVSDASGRFRTAVLVSRGMTAWPWLRVRARVVSVWAEGHRCAQDVPLPAEGELVIALAATTSPAVRRETCRPVAAPVEQIPRYARLWRSLHAGAVPDLPAPPAPDLARSLEARAHLGFGANCQGPVRQLSLAPGGEHAALLVETEGGADVQVVALAEPQATAVAARASAVPGQRLHWRAPGILALAAPQEPPARGARLAGEAPSLAGPVIWRDPGLSVFPAAPAPPGSDPEAAPTSEPELLPALNDEAATRFRGRSFQQLQTLDAETGLPRDQLRVSEPTGERRVLDLPGEACRAAGRYGRPHYRLAADGRTGLDLRFVDGACHAVAVDLESGDWRVLGSTGGTARCQRSRRIPRTQLELALRGYLREIDGRLERAGLDPAAAFTLALGPGRSTAIETVDARGARRILSGPPFPVATPLARIEVSVVAPPPQGHPASVDAAPEGWDPL